MEATKNIENEVGDHIESEIKWKIQHDKEEHALYLSLQSIYGREIDVKLTTHHSPSYD